MMVMRNATVYLAASMFFSTGLTAGEDNPPLPAKYLPTGGWQNVQWQDPGGWHTIDVTRYGCLPGDPAIDAAASERLQSNRKGTVHEGKTLCGDAMFDVGGYRLLRDGRRIGGGTRGGAQRPERAPLSHGVQDADAGDGGRQVEDAYGRKEAPADDGVLGCPAPGGLGQAGIRRR